MVWKSEKRGVHSGNTLRASNSKYNRLYKSQSCLVRNLKDSESKDTILDELSISSDGIEYSLNKKGRWVVPQLLKEHISRENKHSNDGVKMQLTESHKIKRPAKCIGFYASKGPIRKVIPRKKTYFNVTSVRSRNLKRKKNSNQKLDEDSLNPDIENVKPELSPELNVEVFYPSPESSSITHNPKYIRNWRGNGGAQHTEEIDQETKSGQSKNGRSKKRARMNSKRINEYIDDYEYTFSEDEEEFIYHSENETYIPRKSSEILLEDILFHASKVQTLFEPRNKAFNTSEDDFSDKTHVKYVRAEEADDVKIPSTDVTEIPVNQNKFTEMLPVYVILPTADIQPEIIRERFGNSYIECNCFPRKFVIDITDRITAFAMKSKILQGTAYTFDFTASIVFEYDMNTDLDCSDENVYKVYLNIKSKLNSVQIETIPDFSQTTVEEIIQRTSFFIETLSSDSFYTRQKISASGKKEIKFQNLDSCLGASMEAYHPSYKMMYTKIFQNQSEYRATTQTSQLESLETCYICFESISLGEKSAMALQSCGHWFCDQCWQDHIRNRLDMGYTKMTCPEYKCEAEVDYPVLLTLINVQYVEQLSRREHDAKVDMLKETKWCPNPNCGRVLKVDNPQKSLNVKCTCGKIVCFDCLQPAHWPASCDFTINYWTRIKEYGNSVIPTDFAKRVDVYGKNCPKCFRFIEKQGGCNYMACCCGIGFCWRCVRPWESHNHSSCRPAGDKENATRKVIKHVSQEEMMSSKGQSKLYKMAIRHRANRHPWKTQVMKSNMWSLSTKLKYFIRKYGSKYETELNEFIVSENSSKTTVDKIPVFLNSMVDLYMEMNYVIEYSAVYLQEEEKGHKSYLMTVLERMSGLVDAIFEIFNLGIDQDIKSVIPSLWKLKQHSRCSLSGLVKIVTLRHSKEQSTVSPSEN